MEKKIFLSVESFDKSSEGLASMEGVRSRTVNIQIDNDQLIYDNRILTQKFYSSQSRNPNHKHSRNVRTGSTIATLPLFALVCETGPMRESNMLPKPIT